MLRKAVSRAAAMAVFWVMLALPRQQVRGGDQLLETVRAGNLASLQSLHTFSCRITATDASAKGSTSLSGDYSRGPEGVRTRYHRDQHFHDVLFKDQRLTQFTRQSASKGRGKARADIRHASNPAVGDCDVWLLGLLAFRGPDSGTVVSFDELLNTPHQLHQVRRVVEAGRELVYVELEHSTSHRKFWFDPAVNYLVRKLVGTTKGQPTEFRSVLEVTRFKELEPGLFFPERVEARYFYNGDNPLSNNVVVFADVRVNRPLPPETFQLRLPAGTTVTDNLQGKVYDVNEDGKPVGPVRSLFTATSSGITPRAPTLEEPASTTSWILPASLGVLLVAVILWVRRRRGQTS
jgi:hypothetical protein